MSGAVFQSLTRNPLGSPDIIGFTQGAALAALIEIVVLHGTQAQVAMAAVVATWSSRCWSTCWPTARACRATG